MAGVVGVGADVLEVARVARAHGRFGDRFLDRVYTAEERAFCLARADAACALAGRFAAKEAVFKALSPAPPAAMAFREIAIGGDGGRPVVKLSGATAALAARRGVKDVLVTISHERAYAVAFAVALAE